MKKTALFLAAILLLSMVVLASCNLINPPAEEPGCTHADENADLLCDLCGAQLETTETPTCEHTSINKDHKCDKCGEIISECVNEEKDHYCDICGLLKFDCVDENSDHNCDYCDKALSKCLDENKDHNCDYCGAKLSECADADKDHNCDYCGAKASECAAAEGSHNCAICGAKLSECAAAEGSHNCAICGETISECAAAEGSHNCAICGKALSECAAAEKSHNCGICNATLSQCADADGNFACDVCGTEMIPDTHEKVSYSLNISDLATGTLSSDSINGKFTIVSGSEIRNRTKTFEGVEYTKSVKIGNNTTKINVSVPGAGKLFFLVQNGSSGADMQFIKVTAPDGTVYDIEFVGNAGGSPVVKIELDVTEGEWVISRGKNGGTQDIFALGLTCVVLKSEENGFELVKEGKVDFLTNQALDFSELRLNGTYSSGKTEPLAAGDYTVDSSAVNTAVSGTYPVVISYKDYAPITFYVNIYAPESIELGFDAVEKLSQNSAAGNGVYYNHSFKEVYMVGDDLSTYGLTVFVVATNGDKTLKFSVKDYEITGFDSSYADYNRLTISAYGVSTEIEVHVTDVEPTPNADGVYQLLVDPAYEGLAGVLSGPYHVFSTIQGALDYAAKIDKAAVKELYIAPGLYKEKLEIEVPNLKIIGLGETPDDVVIEWDSLYGLVDAGGFTHTTDSTQTVAIRDSAYNVSIENVTISNYWNSQERMDAAGLEIERGLALLVQADRFTMKNSKLLGIQDTLELFTGRQYFENVFISGYTDFIFGTNNTTYFKNCTIHVIYTNKVDKGTAGYLTAFKGSNKGASDAIVYGAIFDGCKFTADERVTAGKTAIGRTWGAYAAVAIINSELGDHISTSYTDGSKDQRYISMNGILPTDATVQFVEYNNTGAGALTEAVAAMKMLTAEEAALYADFSVIFGTINGNVTYLDPWNPESTEIVVDDRTYYYFNGTEGTSGTSYTYTDNIQGSVVEWNGLTIDATTGKLTARGSDAQFNQGAKIIFNVEAGTLVTVISYPGYGYYTINGIAHNANDTFSVYFADATQVVIEATATAYIYQIIINPNEEAPEAPVLNEIKVSGLNANFTVGDELNLGDVVVKAIYSDNSIHFVTDYAVDYSAVNTAAEGSYDVVFTYGGKSVTLTVEYEDPNADPAITKDIVLDFKTTAGLETVQNNPRVTISGSVRHNGGEIQIKGTISFPVKAGTLVKVIPFANTQYASYTLGMEGEEGLETQNAEYSILTTKDCVVVYTGLDNNYLQQIIIECPVLGELEVSFGSEGNYKDSGIDFTGANMRDNGGNNSQMSSGSFSFRVQAGAIVTINGYPNYTSYSINGGEEITATKYVYIAEGNELVTIAAVNSNNYFYSFSVTYPVCLGENTVVSFGSSGNYKDSGIDFSGANVRDNGGNNSQISSGSFSFRVKAGATVTINGYSGYTSYSFNGSEEITAETYVYTAKADGVITITPVNGNNYFYSFSISYPAVKESFEVTFGSEGNYKDSGIDFSGANVRDNGGNNSQISSGSFSIQLLEGAKLTINGYPNYTSYSINGGSEITEDTYVYTAAADETIVIAPVNGNNYFYSFKVEY